jgi:hypothetical protein
VPIPPALANLQKRGKTGQSPTGQKRPSAQDVNAMMEASGRRAGRPTIAE